MRRLILFRHAKSDWSSDVGDDHERGLAPRGRRAAGPMGAWLAGRGFRPDLVLCSTAKRARATWNLACSAFQPSPEVKHEQDIYAASANALLDVIRRTPADVQTLLIVGHNPGLEQSVELLASTGDAEARRLLSEKFPTAAIAVLDFPVDDWAAVTPGSGRLDRFVTPKALGLADT